MTCKQREPPCNAHALTENVCYNHITNESMSTWVKHWYSKICSPVKAWTDRWSVNASAVSSTQCCGWSQQSHEDISKKKKKMKLLFAAAVRLSAHWALWQHERLPRSRWARLCLALFTSLSTSLYVMLLLSTAGAHCTNRSTGPARHGWPRLRTNHCPHVRWSWSHILSWSYFTHCERHAQ